MEPEADWWWNNREIGRVETRTKRFFAANGFRSSRANNNNNNVLDDIAEENENSDREEGVDDAEVGLLVEEDNNEDEEESDDHAGSSASEISSETPFDGELSDENNDYDEEDEDDDGSILHHPWERGWRQSRLYDAQNGESLEAVLARIHVHSSISAVHRSRIVKVHHA